MTPAVGYALREQNRYILDDPAINAVEITFERADDPLRVERYLDDAEFDHVSIHALKLSPGSPDPPNPRYLEALGAIAEENGAVSISDHLGFTRDGDQGVEMGHFAPLPCTTAALDVACRNLEMIQRHFAPIDFYIENIACLFRLAGEMSEAKFLGRLLSRTGCGWLLDITNVYANSVNFNFDPYVFIAQVVPHAERMQIHLAGGFFDESLQKYIDSHSHPLPDEVWRLYQFTLERCVGKVTAVFVERDQNFPDEQGWRAEIQRVRRLADEAAANAAGAARGDSGASSPPVDPLCN